MEVLEKKRLWDDALLCSWPALASWMERQEQRWWAFWLFLRVDNGGREPLQVMGSLEGRDIVPLSGGCCSRSLPSRISPKAGIQGGHWSGWCCDSFLCPDLPSSQPHPLTHSFSFAGPEQRAAYFSLCESFHCLLSSLFWEWVALPTFLNSCVTPVHWVESSGIYHPNWEQTLLPHSRETGITKDSPEDKLLQVTKTQCK